MEEDFGTALKKSLKHDFTLIFIRNTGTNSLTLLKRLGNIKVVRGNDLLRYQRGYFRRAFSEVYSPG